MTRLPHFGQNKNFLYNPKTESLLLILNACRQVQFWKNQMKRFWEKFNSVDFGPKNYPLSSVQCPPEETCLNTKIYNKNW